MVSTLLDHLGAAFLRNLREHPSIKVRSLTLDENSDLVRVDIHGTDLYLSRVGGGNWGIYRRAELLDAPTAEKEAADFRAESAQLAKRSLDACIQASITMHLRKITYPPIKESP